MPPVRMFSRRRLFALCTNPYFNELVPTTSPTSVGQDIAFFRASAADIF